MPQNPGEEKPVMLIVILSPTDCVPTAMAIQAHMPDNVVILKTRFSNQDEPENSGHETRLRSWLNGADDLISTFDDLSEPFPFPITRPKGYTSICPPLEESWLSCHVDEILSIIDDYCKRWEGEVRVDILPGAKNPLIPTLLGSYSRSYSIWYTLEDGRSVNLGSGKEGEIIAGNPLSIVDRAWLSGHPVHVEEGRLEPPPQRSMDLFNHISSKLQRDPPRPDMKNLHLKIFDQALSIAPEEFAAEMEKLGYEVSKEFRDIDLESSGDYMTISKDDISEEFHIEYPPQSKLSGRPGYWLETIASSLLWAHWKPISTAGGVSVIQPTAEMRQRSFVRLWRRGFQDLREGKTESQEALQFLSQCDILSLPHDCEFDDFIQHEINYMKSPDRSSNQLLRFIRYAEIDTIILDRFGVSSFDSKVVIGAKSNRRVELQKAMQLARWMTGGQYILVSSNHPPMDMGKYPNLIHLQRLIKGRASLLDKERALPNPIPDFTIKARSRNWRGGTPQTFKASGYRIRFVPPSRLTFLDDHSNPTHGAIICNNVDQQAVAFSAIRNGYIPEQVLPILKSSKGHDISKYLHGVSQKVGLKICISHIKRTQYGPIPVVFSTVRMRDKGGIDLPWKRYDITLKSLQRFIEESRLVGPLSTNRILFFDTEEDLPELDLLDAIRKIDEEE